MDEILDGAQGAAGCFPKELIKFFEGGSRLLLVKGKSKVGKTVFLLSLAETLGPPMNLFIVNTREPEPRSYETYPWLATNEARDKALENIPAAEMQSKKDADVTLVSETGAKIKSARDLLKSILGEDSVAAPGTTEKKSAPQVSLISGPAELASLRNALGNKNPRELLRVYRGLEAVGSARAFVGVNRIDRLGEKYDIPLRPLALALKADIVSARNAHLVIVLEKPATTVDDISDGIVTLKDVSHGDEFLGQLEIGKLTDVPFKQSKWMYNTISGKFQVLKGISTL